jgi:hypothetical protein
MANALVVTALKLKQIPSRVGMFFFKLKELF